MSQPLDAALAQHAHETLFRAPTPLDPLKHLSARLGTNIYLKRDDLTDLALGGDKPRKLEYELAVAREQNATVLVTCGSSQSNHARLTTAAARKLGMDCAVVLSRDQYAQLQGNLLTVHLMGAQVRLIDAADHWDLEHHALAFCDELRAAGQRPYYVPVSGTTPRSCLGYVRAGLELADQLAERKLQLDAIYVPFGTGGIFTATLLALRESEVDCPLIGISVNRTRADCIQYVDRWWDPLCDLLGRRRTMDRGPIELYDEFVGKEYGDPTEASLDAILLMANSEGVLLDPVYSGKTCAGFFAHHTKGRWKAHHHVALWHSGGVPALFAYHDVIRAHLVKRGSLSGM